MNTYSLTGDHTVLPGASPSLRSGSNNPAFVRRMAARLALETLRIEKIAQTATREVWEESPRLPRFPRPVARTIEPKSGITP